MKKAYLLLFIFAMSFSACETNDNSSSSNPDDTTFAQNFGASVSRDFIGQVVDAANNPIQNATIKIGTSTVQTDVNGVFIINGASVYEKFAYITAKKVGYIDGSRAMVPTSGKNNVRIMMIENTPQATIQSGETSEVSIYSGTKVVFDGAFQDENGNDYTGSVQVSMFHLTPSDENISKLMPGMLYAQTENNEEAVLETFGMLNVELRGNAGQKLNIKTGHKADITLRIDDSQLATAPATLPLWHFDEEKGYWKEDGTATKVGDKYVGTVSHFSWWNCDYPYNTVLLTATVNSANSNAMSNIILELIPLDQTYGSIGITDTNGQVSGLVPANKSLTLNIYANSNCETIVYTSTIGPFSTDTILPTITLNNSVLFSNVVGNLLKCDNTPVSNGYVVLKSYNIYDFTPVTNGSFSFNKNYCSNITEFKLKGVDADNLQQTDFINYNYVSPITNVGNLQTCNTINDFISYQIDSNPIRNFVNNVYAQISGNTIEIFDEEYLNFSTGFVIHGNTITPGTYTTNQFYLRDFYNNNTWVNSLIPNTVQFHLNQVGEVGEYIDMTFNGTYNDTNGTTHTITGVVHVIRYN